MSVIIRHEPQKQDIQLNTYYREIDWLEFSPWIVLRIWFHTIQWFHSERTIIDSHPLSGYFLVWQNHILQSAALEKYHYEHHWAHWYPLWKIIAKKHIICNNLSNKAMLFSTCILNYFWKWPSTPVPCIKECRFCNFGVSSCACSWEVDSITSLSMNALHRSCCVALVTFWHCVPKKMTHHGKGYVSLQQQ